MSKREKTRWERRERKYRKRRYGMRMSGRSVKAVLLRLIGKRTKQTKETDTEAKRDQPEKRE
ncbi:MAG: hypothetical protein MUP04_07635 [Anaerolineae bacterium]|nr:hypothetical protein [Anaerolineae bacterium]